MPRDGWPGRGEKYRSTLLGSEVIWKVEYDIGIPGNLICATCLYCEAAPWLTGTRVTLLAVAVLGMERIEDDAV